MQQRMVRKGGERCENMIDIHAHILPGVDDGPSDWEETERLLELAGEQGIHHIIATPHYTEETDGIQLRELLSKTADILQKVDGITRKAGNILDDDHIEKPRIRIGHHLLKFFAVFYFCARKPLIGI